MSTRYSKKLEDAADIYLRQFPFFAASKKFFTGFVFICFYSFFLFFICSLRLNVFFSLFLKVQCSNFFRYSEFLGNSNGKKWSQIGTFLLKNGLKLPRQKKKIFCGFCYLFKHLFASTSKNPMSKLFRFLYSFGKSNGKKWSQIWNFCLIQGVKPLRKKTFFFFGYL